MENQKLPFGLLFSEKSNCEHTFIQPYYDEDRDINVVELQNGILIPIVESSQSNLSTITKTKADGESTDTDEEKRLFLGTKTKTYTALEKDDKDE